jgi:hypothetical protein
MAETEPGTFPAPGGMRSEGEEEGGGFSYVLAMFPVDLTAGSPYVQSLVQVDGMIADLFHPCGLRL